MVLRQEKRYRLFIFGCEGPFHQYCTSGMRIVVGGKTVSLLNVQLASEQLPACPCFGILTFICVTS